MAQQTINIGATGDDGTGDSIRAGGEKINANFTELYASTAANAAKFSNNTITVNVEADFPVQDAATITLEAGKIYLIGGTITTSKRFICESGTTIRGLSQIPIGIEYTGTGSMFTSTGTWELIQINVSASNGSVFDASGVNAFIIMHIVIISSCVSIGTFVNAGIFWTQGSSTSTTSGDVISFSGTTAGVLIDVTQHTNLTAGNVLINLGTATTSLFRITNSTYIAPATSVGISGLVSSGNINAGSKAVVSITDLAIAGSTPLAGITREDVRWFFAEATAIKNSRNAGDAFLTSLETVVVAATATFYEVSSSSWGSAVQDRFSTSASGVITYDGEVDIDIKISGFATVAKVGGGADEVEVRAGVNWTAADTGLARSGGTTESATPTSVPIEALVSISPGDNIRMIISNNGSTANVEVSKASFVISEA
jgi:hypothetical protein